MDREGLQFLWEAAVVVGNGSPSCMQDRWGRELARERRWGGSPVARGQEHESLSERGERNDVGDKEASRDVGQAVDGHEVVRGREINVGGEEAGGGGNAGEERGGGRGRGGEPRG